LAKWLIQLTAATALLAVGIQLAERHLSPLTRFGASLLFGLIWVVAGCKAFFLRSGTIEGPYATATRNVRVLGILFVLFGAAWIAVSSYQLLTTSP
jgi:hypothetical protein